MFINMAQLYLRIKMIGEPEPTKIAQVLLYMQGKVAEAQKDNLLDELAKEKAEVSIVEELFTKMRNKFGETTEEDKKIEALRTIEQRGRTCDKYVQEFKKVARGSGYEGKPLIEEFKRGLSLGEEDHMETGEIK